MFSVLKNYCNETTLHGFKYFTEANCRKSEKIFWFISLLLSFLSATWLIHKLIVEIQETPIITVTSNTPVAIGEVPFPAITFCQEIDIQEGNPVYQVIDEFYNRNDESNMIVGNSALYVKAG